MAQDHSLNNQGKNLFRVFPPVNERISSACSSVATKPVVLPWLNRRHTEAARSSQRAFDGPASKDATGTVETLARMARFIIADLTDPSSVPHELATIVPFLRTTPVVTLRLSGTVGYGMFEDFQRFRWVLPTYEYPDGPTLISNLGQVIEPAEKMAQDYRTDLSSPGAKRSSGLP